MMVANATTGEWATLMSFFDLDQFFRDLDVVVDSGPRQGRHRHPDRAVLPPQLRPEEGPQGHDPA